MLAQSFFVWYVRSVQSGRETALCQSIDPEQFGARGGVVPSLPVPRLRETAIGSPVLPGTGDTGLFGTRGNRKILPVVPLLAGVETTRSTLAYAVVPETDIWAADDPSREG